jgi:hypothetical protein
MSCAGPALAAPLADFGSDVNIDKGDFRPISARLIAFPVA